jgi:hypothetical protein
MIEPSASTIMIDYAALRLGLAGPMVAFSIAGGTTPPSCFKAQEWRRVSVKLYKASGTEMSVAISPPTGSSTLSYLEL